MRLSEQNPALVVKWLSRLPVTEEIAGSNPVERANIKAHALGMGFYIAHSTD